MIHVFSDNTLRFNGGTYRCALGRAGVVPAENKREGDGGTPAGIYPIRSVWFRPDRVALPPLAFPVYEITRADGWCDAPLHPQYNRHVTLPLDASHEELWREDNRYDAMVVLGHNDAPPVPHRGSCIFWHIAGDGFPPTEGCIAMGLQDMVQILTQLSAETMFQVHQSQ